MEVCHAFVEREVAEIAPVHHHAIEDKVFEDFARHLLARFVICGLALLVYYWLMIP